MKVVIFEAEEWEARACRALSGNHELTCVKERLTSDNAAKYSDAEVISTFINSRLDAEVLLDAISQVTEKEEEFYHVGHPLAPKGKPAVAPPGGRPGCSPAATCRA